MAMSRRAQIVLSGDDRKCLERIRTNSYSILKHFRRANIILRPGGGLTLSQTMRATGMPKPTVRRWRDRFLVKGVDCMLRDIPRKAGGKPAPEETAQETIEAAMPPPEHAGHWTLRALAERLGIVDSTVSGILKLRRLKPNQVRTVKVSRDPKFEQKVRDVVGLRVDPLDHAVVISADEKTQMQALGRTQRPLPMKPGHPDLRCHFRPSAASWMNAVEGVFSKLSRQRLKHPVFDSVDEFAAAIEDCIEHQNAAGSRPFRWSRKPEDLVEAWKTGHRNLQELAS